MLDCEPEVTAEKMKYKILGRRTMDTVLSDSDKNEDFQRNILPLRKRPVAELKFFDAPPFEGIGKYIRAATEKVYAELREKKRRIAKLRAERPHVRLVE